MTTNVIQPSFAAGELSPGLAARVDLAKYHVGAALLENFFVDYKGGVSSRPGTQFIGKPQVSDSFCWLYKFVFSATQQYVLVFSNLALQFVRNPGTIPAYANGSEAGFILSGGLPYTIVTPYGTADFLDLKFAQSGDLLQITHPNHPRMVLRRLGETNWTLTEPAIGASITSPPNVRTSITGLPSGSTDPQNTTNLYTVTSVSKGGEESALAGPGSTLGYFSLITGIDMGVTPGTVTVQWNDVVDADYYNVYKAIPGYGGTVPPYTSSFGFCGIAYGNQFTDSNIVPDFTKAPPLHRNPFSPKQIERITITGSSTDWPVGFTEITITDSTGTGARAVAVLNATTAGATSSIVDVFIIAGGENYTAPVITASAVGGATAGTSFTATAVLSGINEWPTSVAYNQQRLVVASTTAYPTGIFGSKTGFYDNFDVSNPVLDDDSFTFVLASSEVNAVKHMVSAPGGLILFTNSSIQQLTGGSNNAQNPAAITPASAVVVPQSYFGASRVRPAVINNDILYVQDPGTGVTDLAYNLFSNIYAGVDITALSSHLFHPNTISCWDYQHTPHKVLWCVRSDGKLLSLTFLKEQEVAAWTQHNTVGTFEAVTCIREGNEDAVYFVVNRSGQRYVERLAGRVYATPADAWCLDSAVSYIGPPITELTGLEHLNGFNVAVLSSGIPAGVHTVVGGHITLVATTTHAVVGLPYTAQMQTVQLDLGNEGASVQGKRKRVAAISVRVRDTAGTVEVGPTFQTMTSFVPNVSSTDRMDLGGLITADMRLIIEPSFNVPGQVCIRQSGPLPVTVLGVIPEIVVGDR